MTGNPYFGKNNMAAFKAACEEDNEIKTKRMNELHLTNYKPKNKKKVKKWWQNVGFVARLKNLAFMNNIYIYYRII